MKKSITLVFLPLCLQVKVYRDAAGPRVLRQLTESVQIGIDTGVWSEDSKQANEKLVEDFKVNEKKKRRTNRIIGDGYRTKSSRDRVGSDVVRADLREIAPTRFCRTHVVLGFMCV